MVENVAQNAGAEHANVVNVQNVDVNLANAKNNPVKNSIEIDEKIRPASAGLIFSCSLFSRKPFFHASCINFITCSSLT